MSSSTHRHAGPKSQQYNELELMIKHYYDMLQKKRPGHAQRFVVNIRKSLLLHGCPEDDIIAETASSKTEDNKYLSRIGRALPTMRRVEDTLRGKLWRLLLGVSNLDASDYKNQIKKAESKEYYVKIRGDTKRTFLTSEEYNSRVSEERLVRVLNSFVHRFDKAYCQGMDAIAAGLLYVMPELDAFAAFCTLINVHFPTYFYSERNQRKKDLIGSYAASFLSWDILRICDFELFKHLNPLPPHTYFFPLVASFQAISQPFTQLQRLWDFLFSFGVHLNCVVAVAQIITNKELIMQQNAARLLQGLLSQRKWMNQRLDARKVIDCTMRLVQVLKEKKHDKLWQNILRHSSDFDVAIQIKVQHENGISAKLYKTITTAHISSDSEPDEVPKMLRKKTKSDVAFGDMNADKIKKIVKEKEDENE